MPIQCQSNWQTSDPLYSMYSVCLHNLIPAVWLLVYVTSSDVMYIYYITC